MDKEKSIFKAAIGTFLKMFFGIFGVCIALLIFSFIFSSLSSPSPIEEKTTLSILTDAKGKREMHPPTTPVVLQIPIHGVIGTPKEINTEIIENILLDSRTGLLSGNRVKAILLHFNTPGGTVVDSEAIYQLLKQYKEDYNIPIFGYVEGLCASGGMYIASAADEMYSGPAGIIGSIGVRIGPFFNIYDAMGKIGVKAETITQGLDKDAMNPTRPWKKDEDAYLKDLTGFMYDRFVDLVVQSRERVNRSRLINEYGARVFDPVTAEKIGYIDYAMVTRGDALTALLKKANLDPEKPYQVVSLSPKHPIIADLLSSKSPLISGKIEHTVEALPKVVREQPCYLYQYGEASSL